MSSSNPTNAGPNSAAASSPPAVPTTAASRTAPQGQPATEAKTTGRQPATPDTSADQPQARRQESFAHLQDFAEAGKPGTASGPPPRPTQVARKAVAPATPIRTRKRPPGISPATADQPARSWLDRPANGILDPQGSVARGPPNRTRHFEASVIAVRSDRNSTENHETGTVADVRQSIDRQRLYLRTNTARRRAGTIVQRHQQLLRCSAGTS